MPGATLPSIPRYVPAPLSKENLDWAELPIVDLSTDTTPEGKAELSALVRDAMHTKGLMYIINHGLTQAQNSRIFDIADVPFSQVPEEEKRQYLSKPKEQGFFRGYKMRQYFHIDNGVRDQIENYSVHHGANGHQQHPKGLRPLLPEIRAFSEHNYHKVLYPILRFLALGLELPEETFVNMHNFNAEGEQGFQSFDAKNAKDVWLKGHVDFTTVSILWNQPVSALQVLLCDGKWHWVKHIENALIVIVGDSMEMLSRGYYEAAIHRVVQPPADQCGFARLGVLYFVMADNNVKLVPLAESPVLQRVGIVRKCKDEDAPTMEQWVRARTSALGQTVLEKKLDGTEEEILEGVFTTLYN